MNDIIRVDPTSVDPDVASRAAEVQRRIGAIRDSTQSNFFELADLLLEAQDKAYHTVYGFSRFGDWVEQGSGLDLSERAAFYLTNIARKVKILGLSRNQVGKVKISALKKIFELDPGENGEQMKQLVADGGELTLEQVQAKVGEIKSEAGKPDFVRMVFKVDTDVKEIVDDAFELARSNYGSSVDAASGEIVDISDSKCLELISAEYLQNPNSHAQPEFGAEHEAEDIPVEEVEL